MMPDGVALDGIAYDGNLCDGIAPDKTVKLNIISIPQQCRSIGTALLAKLYLTEN